MKKNNDTCTEMYGISRIDCNTHNAHAWRVSLSRRGKRHVKNFTDKSCGSQGAALKKAIAYRDKLLVEHPPITRKEFCNAKRRNNKTGITGVYKYKKSYQLKDGSIKDYWYWEANWPDVAGESISKSFSINKLGEITAKEMAISAREDGMKNVDGIFWAAERGEVQAANALKHS